MNETNEQKDIRTTKLAALRDSGINPYPNKFDDRIYSKQALELEEGNRARIAGRLMSRRMMGKASFAHLKDLSGNLQIYIRLDKVGEEAFSLFKGSDIGDFFGYVVR